MKVSKSGFAAGGGETGKEEMELISSFARKKLSPEEVYTFSLVLCDNEIDRDFERFSEKTLRELGELFVGKTGISDHNWSAGNQVARIYRTELVRDPAKKTAAGEELLSLKAWAYMLRTPGNAELIAQIEGGIKKETSVGCAVAESLCSICGKPIGSPECGHSKGQDYGGKLCHAVLNGAVDAYEWSFVAVPAQKNAGVTKAFDASKGLEGFVRSETGRDFLPEFQQVQKEAALGRKYLAELRSQVRRLALVCDRELYESLEGTLESMEPEALEKLKTVFEKKAAEALPLFTQLPGSGEVTRFDGGEYLV